MSPKRNRSNQKTKATILVPAQARRLSLCGPPLLLPGEDEAAYAELLAEVFAAVKPTDFIEELWVADCIALHWEMMRWQRLKTGGQQSTNCSDLRDRHEVFASCSLGLGDSKS